MNTEKLVEMTGYETLEMARAALRIKHNADCTDDCRTQYHGWHVSEADGQAYVVYTHDTYSGDGFGAWFQTPWDSFSTRDAAQAALDMAKL